MDDDDTATRMDEGPPTMPPPPGHPIGSVLVRTSVVAWVLGVGRQWVSAIAGDLGRHQAIPALGRVWALADLWDAITGTDLGRAWGPDVTVRLVRLVSALESWRGERPSIVGVADLAWLGIVEPTDDAPAPEEGEAS